MAPPDGCISFTSSLQQKKQEFKFASITWNQSSSSSSSTVLEAPTIPALFTATSSFPYFSWISAKSAFTASLLLTSHFMNSPFPPASSIAATTAAPRSSLRPTATTVAPSFAARIATALPIPEVAPVTSIIFSSKRPIIKPPKFIQ